MAEQITGRPEGGREGDFSELNDWTVTDIATAPHTSPEDRQNAKAEIARRKEEGTYSPEDSTQNTQSDLLDNGYGVQEGKITYPTAEYKEFMNSDRSGEVPTGVVRESLEDRIKNAEALPKIEDQQAMGQLVNEVEPESFDNDNQSDNEEDLYNEWGFNIDDSNFKKNLKTRPTSTTRAHKKLLDEFDKRAAASMAEEKPEAIAKENAPVEEEKPVETPATKIAITAPEVDAEEKAFDEAEQAYKDWGFDVDEPRRERMIKTTEKAKKAPAEHAEKAPESIEERIEKAYNYYNNNFSKDAIKWATYGVSTLLERGLTDIPKNAFISEGFAVREEGRIHERIDPENEYTEETLEGEHALKGNVQRDIISKRADELSNEDLLKAKHDGTLYAIYSGVRKEQLTEKPIFSIQSESGDDVIKMMKESGLNPNDEGIRSMSYNGFLNIVDAIKDDSKSTEQGFKTLDWYVDTFKYQKHMHDLMAEAEERSEEDSLFKEKLDEYLNYRFKSEKEEAEKDLKLVKSREQKAIAKSKPIEYKKLIDYLESNLIQEGNHDIFEAGNINYKTGAYANLPKSFSSSPSLRERSAFALEQVEMIKNLDPDADFRYSRVYDSTEENKEDGEREATHIIIRFGYNENNNVIAVPVSDKSRYMYVWKGKTGNDRDAWMPIFEGSSRNRDDSVKAKMCKGYTKEGVEALRREWERVWDHLGGVPSTQGSIKIPDALVKKTEEKKEETNSVEITG